MSVAMIGAGYVGLVTGACLAHLGHQVVCVDQDTLRTDAINNGEAPFFEPGLAELITTGRSRGLLSATTDLDAAVRQAEITFIAVGTPSAGDAIDLGQVRAAAEAIGEALKDTADDHVVVIKSTVVPGTCEGVVAPIISARSGRGANCVTTCVNPEFLRQGHAVDDFLDPDRIVIGASDEQAKNALLALYERLDAPRILTSPKNAELIKYACNALLATMISFSNEIANICEATPGTDVETVLRGVHLDGRITIRTEDGATTPGLVSYLMAGGGFGGSCLPKDVKALKAYAEGRGVRVHMLESVLAVNNERPERLVRMAEQALGDLAEKKVAVLGLTFKAGTDDIRDSPALAVVQALLDRGASVTAWDPKVRFHEPDIPRKVTLVQTPKTAMSGASCAIIATAWPELLRVDWKASAATMAVQLIIDGRQALQGTALPESVDYRTVGSCHAFKTGS